MCISSVAQGLLLREDRQFGLPDKVGALRLCPVVEMLLKQPRLRFGKDGHHATRIAERQCVLITAHGLVRQRSRASPASPAAAANVRIFSRDEQKQETMPRNLNEPRLRCTKDCGAIPGPRRCACRAPRLLCPAPSRLAIAGTIVGRERLLSTRRIRSARCAA